MIYFEFNLSRVTEFGRAEPATADFMFDSDNPAECTRRAVTLLKSHGWRATSVRKAQEYFRREDFSLEERAGGLYDQALVHGFSFLLPSDLAETASCSLAQVA